MSAFLSNTFIPRSTFLLLFFLAKIFAAAQVSVSLDRASQQYSAGETVRFRVVSAAGGAVSFRIGYDAITPVLQTGVLQTVAGVPAEVNFSLPAAGAVFFWAEQGIEKHSAQAVFSPQQIQPAETEPADFDTFWAVQATAAKALPLNPVLTFVHSTARSTTWLLQLDHLDGRKIYGYLSVPIAPAGSQFPALVHFPPLGFNAGLVHPLDYMTDELGCLTLALSIHNASPDQTDPLAYQPNDATNRNNIYYRYAVLLGLRAVDYLFSRADFDKSNLALAGESQGGGLAMMVAGLDARVDLVVGSITALSEHGAWKFGRATGFPNYVYTANFSTQNPAIVDATQAASKYYDAQFFARRFAGETLSAISYRDEVSAAATIFSMLNQTRGRQTILHALELEHNHPDEYWLARNDAIRRVLSPTRTPANNPFPPSGTGYHADAGADFSEIENQSANLAGRVFQNQIENSSFPVRWEMVSGPAAVQFANANSRSTSAIFPAAGTYVLRFSAADESLLSSKKRIFTAVDFVKIEVAAAPPPCSISASASQTICRDAGTPFDGSDDFWETTLTVTATNSGTGGWQATFLNRNISGNFNQPTLVSNLPMGQNVSFNFSDAQILTCTKNLSVVAPQPCVQNPPPPDPTVCNPRGLEPWWQWIKKVEFAGISNTSSKEQFWFFQNQTGQVEQGKFYPILLTPDFSWLTYPEFWRVWVDWNSDGDFLDVGEKVFEASGTAQVSGQILVPQNAPTGIVRMRIAMKKDAFADPCEEFQFGEVEDYQLNIKSAAPVCSISAAASQQTCLDNGTPTLAADDTWRVTLTVAATNAGSGGWRANFVNCSITGQYGVATVISDLPFGSNLSFSIFDVQNPTCAQTISVAPPPSCAQNPPPPTGSFCSYSSDNPWQEWISQVRVNSSFVKNSSKSSYSNFTGSEIPMRANRNQSLRLEARFSFQTVACKWQVWVDLNQNKVFDAPSEMLLFATAPVPQSGNNVTSTTFANIFIPASAKNGQTRMRIVFAPVLNSTPCGTIPFGEVEDYTVVISDGVNSLQGGDSDSREFKLEKSSVEKLVVFPNPADERLFVEASIFKNQPVEILVFDLFGKEVLRKELPVVSGEVLEIQAVGLENGLYFLQVKSPLRRARTQKFVVEHGQ